MKIQGTLNTKIENPKDDLRSKLADKFGEKFQNAEIKNVAMQPVSLPEDKVSLRSKNTENLDSPDYSLKTDVGVNDPGSTVTREKLRELLKTNGFDWSPKEREALQQILKVSA